MHFQKESRVRKRDSGHEMLIFLVSSNHYSILWMQNIPGLVAVQLIVSWFLGRRNTYFPLSTLGTTILQKFMPKSMVGVRFYGLNWHVSYKCVTQPGLTWLHFGLWRYWDLSVMASLDYKLVFATGYHKMIHKIRTPDCTSGKRVHVGVNIYLCFLLYSELNLVHHWGVKQIVISYIWWWQVQEMMNQKHGSKRRCLRRTQTGPW